MSTNGVPPSVPVTCVPCSQLDAGASAICVSHRRAYVGPDAPAVIAELIKATATKNGIAVKVADAAISVEVEIVDGAHVVRILLPVGAQNVALRLPPDIALNLAACIVQAAREAKNPAGLILPG